MEEVSVTEPDAIEAVTMRKLSRKIVPFLMLCYCAAYVDRVNVGFAGLTMNKDLGFTATVFGAGAGLFFLGYVLFEVPSNLALYKFGARLSLARIMICWGLLATASAFISGPHSFYMIRFLLGAAEAGFFPGVLFYLTLWFPKAYRGRIVSMFMTSIPVSVMIGAPLSSLLLKLDGAMSMRGWQWLFVIEGLPAVLLGVLVLFMLADKPADAAWLSDEEKSWLNQRLAREGQQTDEAQSSSIFRALTSGYTLGFALAYFGLVTCTVGVSFWLPQIVKSLGLDDLQTGLVTAIPSVAALIGMVLIGRSSDRHTERKWHCAAGFAFGAAGLAATALGGNPAWQIFAFSMAAFGLQGSQPVFWTLPSAAVSGSAAAASLALVNSVGSLAGFWGPWIIGVVKDATGSFKGGILVLAASGLLAALLVIALASATKKRRTHNGVKSSSAEGTTRFDAR